MTQAPKLKTCPFCGSQPDFAAVTDVGDGFEHHFMIWCGECGIEMADESRDEVAARWNKRFLVKRRVPLKPLLIDEDA